MQPDRAAELYRYVITELTASDGPESLRVLEAHADLARMEYAAGDCAAARNRLSGTWELHREVYGDGHHKGLRMLARLGVMQRGCGRAAEGAASLALAGEFCRQHLRPDDPLVAQIAALAEGGAEPAHDCQDPPGDAAPASAGEERVAAATAAREATAEGPVSAHPARPGTAASPRPPGCHRRRRSRRLPDGAFRRDPVRARTVPGRGASPHRTHAVSPHPSDGGSSSSPAARPPDGRTGWRSYWPGW